MKKAQGVLGNHYDLETGEEYWVSGVKRDGSDRHRLGSGKIFIDKTVIDDYLKFVNLSSLPGSKFTVVELNNIPQKGLSEYLENSI